MNSTIKPSPKASQRRQHPWIRPVVCVLLGLSTALAATGQELVVQASTDFVLAHNGVRGYYPRHRSYGSVWIAPTWTIPVRPYAYVPPAVIVTQPAPPPTYIERPAITAETQDWFYCAPLQRYYPYTETCPEAWVRVAPFTPPAEPQP